MGERKLSFKPIDLREADFKRAVNAFLKYPPDMRTEFIDYWTEPNKSGSRMRFEGEKTWDTGRRLARWASHDFGKGPKVEAPVVHMSTKERMSEPKNDIERLDALLERFQKSHIPAKPEELAPFAKPITENELWPSSITKEQMDKAKIHYKNDPILVKSYFVERTLVYYISFGLTFSGAMKAKNK